MKEICKESVLLNEMIEMQKALDSAIEKEFKLEYGIDRRYTLEGLKIALLDEIGEMIHESKANWCWWKKTQKPVDREKLLEELVDCYHFALSIAYHEHYEFSKEAINYLLPRSLSWLVAKMLTSSELILEIMVCITRKIGFTIDDVYEAYKKKNKVNYERIEENY